MTIETILSEQCDRIQSNLIALLDGHDNEFVDNVCEMIVDRFEIIRQAICDD